jgi:hypothetical protein
MTSSSEPLRDPMTDPCLLPYDGMPPEEYVRRRKELTHWMKFDAEMLALRNKPDRTRPLVTACTCRRKPGERGDNRVLFEGKVYRSIRNLSLAHDVPISSIRYAIREGRPVRRKGRWYVFHCYECFLRNSKG